MEIPLVLLSLFLVFSCVTALCQRCAHHSKAAFVDSHAVSAGACGYGPTALDFNGGFIAAASSSLYRGGVGCGACYQIRCKNPRLCRGSGVTVAVTDLNQSNETAFALNLPAFKAMAKDGMDKELVRLGILDVEYKRVPCTYKDRRLMVRVQESSQKHSYLAIEFLYLHGQADILDVRVASVSSEQWHSMSRSYGAVWDISQPPMGPLKLGVNIMRGDQKEWIMADKEDLPEGWTPGGLYKPWFDIARYVQLEHCSPCDINEWK